MSFKKKFSFSPPINGDPASDFTTSVSNICRCCGEGDDDIGSIGGSIFVPFPVDDEDDGAE
jgi:hypothetical protein